MVPVARLDVEFDAIAVIERREPLRRVENQLAALVVGVGSARYDAFRLQPVEQLLLDTKGVTTVQTSVGGSGSAIGDAFGGGSGGTTFSVTTDESADQDALQATLRDKLKGLKDVGDVELAASSGFGGSRKRSISTRRTSITSIMPTRSARRAR